MTNCTKVVTNFCDIYLTNFASKNGYKSKGEYAPPKKREMEELLKTLEEESKPMQKYKRWQTGAVIIAPLTVILIPVIIIKNKSSSIWEISHFWEIIIPLGVIFFMLVEPPRIVSAADYRKVGRFGFS